MSIVPVGGGRMAKATRRRKLQETSDETHNSSAGFLSRGTMGIMYTPTLETLWGCGGRGSPVRGQARPRIERQIMAFPVSRRSHRCAPGKREKKGSDPEGSYRVDHGSETTSNLHGVRWRKTKGSTGVGGEVRGKEGIRRVS